MQPHLQLLQGCGFRGIEDVFCVTLQRFQPEQPDEQLVPDATDRVHEGRDRVREVSQGVRHPAQGASGLRGHTWAGRMHRCSQHGAGLACFHEALVRCTRRLRESRCSPGPILAEEVLARGAPSQNALHVGTRARRYGSARYGIAERYRHACALRWSHKAGTKRAPRCAASRGSSPLTADPLTP